MRFCRIDRDEILTFMRSTGSVCCAAVLSRAEYSMYSTMRCRNERGSLKMTGMVILLSSLPMQFFSTDHTLKSLWLYIGTGRLCLLAPRKTHHIVSESHPISERRPTRRAVCIFEISIFLCRVQKAKTRAAAQ